MPEKGSRERPWSMPRRTAAELIYDSDSPMQRFMRDFLPSAAQMAGLSPHFPLAHGVSRVDDRRVVSSIVYVIWNGLQWKDAIDAYGPHGTRLHQVKKLSGRACPCQIPKTSWSAISQKSAWSFWPRGDQKADGNASYWCRQGQSRRRIGEVPGCKDRQLYRSEPEAAET